MITPKRLFLWLLVVLVLGGGTYGGIVVLHAQSGLRNAQEMMTHELWPQARARINDYLWLHPNDGEARLMMAETFARDETLASPQAATEAIQHLARVPDDSPVAAEARLRQARLHFLILHQPGRAEELVLEAIALQPDELAAYELLWTLLNVTGRAEMAEDVFWRMYELTPEPQRPLRLREWYLSLFFPATANETLDRMMGILAPNETGNRTTESRRYIRFRDAEPHAAVNHAALARWCQLEGDLDFATRLLEAAKEQVDDPNSDPFFLAVNIAVQLDLGEFEKAEALFRQWPEDDRGHFYWRTRALILDDVEADYQQALEAYDRAIALWPGPADWRLQFQKAGCLARLRRADEAADVRSHAQDVQALMVPEAHERLLAALNALDDPGQVAQLIDFYERLGREREVAAWESYARSLPAKPNATSPQDAPGNDTSPERTAEE